jgi:hypothetical protein
VLLPVEGFISFIANSNSSFCFMADDVINSVVGYLILCLLNSLPLNKKTKRVKNLSMIRLMTMRRQYNLLRSSNPTSLSRQSTRAWHFRTVKNTGRPTFKA